MRINDCYELFCGGGRNGCYHEVVNLTADQDQFAVDLTVVKVTFMHGGLEFEFVSLQDPNYHLLPQCTCFRMTLKCSFKRDNMSLGININFVSFAMPRVIRTNTIQLKD
jgi:hypothetical protein